LMDCTIAKIFWEQTKELTGVKLPNLRTETWARDLLFWGSAMDREIIICGMWSLWMFRNKRRHGEAAMPIRQAVLWVRDTAFDLWQILHPQKQVKVREAQARWEPPCAGWVKCNVDAVFMFETRRGATGGVLRDDHGRFLGGQAKSYGQCMDALASEACAYRDGMDLAERHGVQRLYLETDCLELTRL
ncbi:hypothetical protein BAE44_0025232, partial [Dichanthelium oligosanthes]